MLFAILITLHVHEPGRQGCGAVSKAPRVLTLYIIHRLQHIATFLTALRTCSFFRRYGGNTSSSKPIFNEPCINRSLWWMEKSSVWISKQRSFYPCGYIFLSLQQWQFAQQPQMGTCTPQALLRSSAHRLWWGAPESRRVGPIYQDLAGCQVIKRC